MTDTDPQAPPDPQRHRIAGATNRSAADRRRRPTTSGPSPAADYEAAAARVEEIIRRLDSGEASLNETLELVREGKALIELLRAAS